MKTYTLLVIGLLTFPLASLRAQWRSDLPPLIEVSGSAEVKVQPDEVDLKVGVETRDENLEVAKQKNDQRVSGALEFLDRNGVKGKDIQTDYISIEPVYDNNDNTRIDPQTGFPEYDKHGALTNPVYYLVRKSIGIKVTNVGSFDGLLTGLITNGVNVVMGIDFRTSEIRKYKDQARSMAIKAAKEKADAMASELGVRVGKPYNISVNDLGGWYSWSPGGWGYGRGGGSPYQYQNTSQNAGNEAGENDATFAVGQISVSANVSVSFLIQ
jgi:uncharacterized protein YggE